MVKEFVTYGFQYDPYLFKPITNRIYSGKPNGGLWASPVNSEFGWKDWCNAALFFKHSGLSEGFIWELSDQSRILVLDETSNLESLPEKYFLDQVDFGGLIEERFLNFEKLAQDYDALLLEYSGLKALSGDYLGFNTWDCESILVFNKEIIKNIKPFKV